MQSFKIVVGLALLNLGVLPLLIQDAIAGEWNDTPCAIGNSQNYQFCRETKGEAVLKGKKGYLHTFTFPNRRKFYWFYGEKSVLCTWKDTYIREEGKNQWLDVQPSCGKNGSINFLLPSGTQLLTITMD